MKRHNPIFTGEIGRWSGVVFMYMHPVTAWIMFYVSAWDSARHYKEIVEQMTGAFNEQNPGLIWDASAGKWARLPRYLPKTTAKWVKA